jgi:hypothetical protein
MPRPDVNMERKMSKKPETTLPQRKSTLQLHLAMLSRRVAGDQDGASALNMR